ncbi:MAG: EAL domain-containing protein [Actinomycetota bacterium]
MQVNRALLRMRGNRDVARGRTAPTTTMGPRLTRSLIGVAVTFVAVLVGREFGVSPPFVLGVGLSVTLTMHAGALVQGLRGYFAEDELTHARQLAHLDELTGLPNRSSIMTEIANAVREANDKHTIMGVIFMDLDRFKAVNDSMGHGVGDELLKVVSARLLAACRTGDVVGRFGGDEFVIITRGLTDADTVRRVAETVRNSFADPIQIDGSELLMGCSIGVTTAGRGDTRTASELLRDADTAMYAAKNERSGVRVFDEHHRQAVVERMGIERELLKALARDQFKVFYQPIISWKNNRISSFEALVRWEHPEFGLIRPDRFLPVVEDSGMMSRLGETVLRETLAQKMEWNHAFGDSDNVSVGVNVAERQLLDRSFPHQVAAAIEWTGVDPAKVTLEITEDVMIERLDDSLTQLRDLAALGVSLVIDDFGTGRSSLAWVKKLDMIDAIKIDRSFITGIPEGHVDMAIIDGIMLMAEALGHRVVAEGVETLEQAQALDSLGVDLMQGYLFARPEPASAVNMDMLLTGPVTAAGGLDEVPVRRIA